jgi:catechol 2,3-dioxygenase-like lactoylglutathione lyase family enzyme
LKDVRSFSGLSIGETQRRRAILALNMAGGGGLEIWQFVSREPQASPETISIGDRGIFAIRLKTNDCKRAFQFLQNSGAHVLSPIMPDPAGVEHFVVQDPYGNTFEIAQYGIPFARTSHIIGGIVGAIIGVADMGRSVRFYSETLGYDRIVFDQSVDGLRRLRLARTAANSGPFSRLLGPAEIDLVLDQRRAAGRIYEGRFWGDLGFIHICFDVRGCDVIHTRAAGLGFPATVDSASSFDMGDAAGRFSYIEDPDGTLIELVETHKVPILKKLGWSIDLRKRPPDRPLPNLILRGLALNRVKDNSA